MGIFEFLRDTGEKIINVAKGDGEDDAGGAEATASKRRPSAADAASRAREAATEAASTAKKQAARAKEAGARQAAQAKKAAAAKQAQAKAAAKQAKSRAEFRERRAEARKADELEKYLSDLGLGDDIDVHFDEGTAFLSGPVADQATLERVVLAVGNVAGVARVDEDLEVAAPADAAQFYTVKPGDTLSGIANQFYGDANRYHEIFEANRPMLSNPDLIYPGQTLRIP